MGFWDTLVMQFKSTFIIDNRWKVFLTGFKNTLLITIVAALIGVVLGTVIAVIHYNAAQKHKRKTLMTYLVAIADKVCMVYVAVMRGTPVAIQLMIMAFLLMAGKDKISGRLYCFRAKLFRLCFRGDSRRHQFRGHRTDGGGPFSWSFQSDDHAQNYSATGCQKYSSGAL